MAILFDLASMSGKEGRMDRFWSKVKKTDSCWEWTASRHWAGHGYCRFNGRTDYAHRVSWELNIGPIPIGMHVLHKCDNPGCVRPDHLFIGTHLDNMKDRDKKGRVNKYMTSEQVIEIRRMSAEKSHTQKQLAKKFKTSIHNIHAIIQRINWRHI